MTFDLQALKRNLRVKIVESFDALVSHAFFGGDVNAICWLRDIEGDFDEVAAHFKDGTDVFSLDEDILNDVAPRLTLRGQQALQAMRHDLDLLRNQGLIPSLECVPRYARDDADAIIATDVYSFHADRAPVLADTYLCSYNQAASEGICNRMVEKTCDMPGKRSALRALCAAEGGGDFEAFLKENSFDLHYGLRAGAKPYDFGLGNMWRIAVDWPGSPVAPCIHRAPFTQEGQLPRLLLIS